MARSLMMSASAPASPLRTPVQMKQHSVVWPQVPLGYCPEWTDASLPLHGIGAEGEDEEEDGHGGM